MKVKALIFDTGDIILDWHSGFCRAFQKIGERHDRSLDWHAVTNDYRRLVMKGIVGQVRPAFNMDDMHRSALDEVLTKYQLHQLSAQERLQIFHAWDELPARPDFPAALTRIRQKFPVIWFTMLPLSLVLDVSRKSDLDWDAVISCEMIGIYKPNPEAYLKVAQWLGMEPAEILMVACHNFDLNAARACGFMTAFVRRPGEWGPEGPPDPTPHTDCDLVVDGFEALADSLDASAGVIFCPPGGANTSNLLRCAGLELGTAKRHHYPVAFGSEMDDEPAFAQLSLMGEMREALKRGEFVVYYQPKLNLAQHKIAAAEALIRWRHPVKGMIPPMQFIPFDEQTGFIRKITPWVLRQVIADAAQWHRDGLAVAPSANLSTLDLLNHALVMDIKNMITQSGLPAGQLCLEITESALMDQPELALKHLHDLSAFGLKLSIDDYGTGQSSLAYVQNLPVNELKIDRAFVIGVDVNRKNAAIVRSTILLCRELGLSVVAEGAETAEELAWLTDNHCDLLQGYVVAKPMPLNEFIAWVEKFNQA